MARYSDATNALAEVANPLARVGKIMWIARLSFTIIAHTYGRIVSWRPRSKLPNYIDYARSITLTPLKQVSCAGLHDVQSQVRCRLGKRSPDNLAANLPRA